VVDPPRLHSVEQVVAEADCLLVLSTQLSGLAAETAGLLAPAAVSC
jgi:hypothetical protein